MKDKKTLMAVLIALVVVIGVFYIRFTPNIAPQNETPDVTASETPDITETVPTGSETPTTPELE